MASLIYDGAKSTETHFVFTCLGKATALRQRPASPKYVSIGALWVLASFLSLDVLILFSTENILAQNFCSSTSYVARNMLGRRFCQIVQRDVASCVATVCCMPTMAGTGNRAGTGAKKKTFFVLSLCLAFHVQTDPPAPTLDRVRPESIPDIMPF